MASLLRPEAPVFCFSPSALRTSIRTFIEGFPGEVSYAMKANPGEDILLTACAVGLDCFDVASVEEMAAIRAIAPRARLHYHNPVKSRAEIARALEVFGCRRFAVDDHQEIAKIAGLADDPAAIELAVRFRLAARRPVGARLFLEIRRHARRSRRDCCAMPWRAAFQPSSPSIPVPSAPTPGPMPVTSRPPRRSPRRRACAFRPSMSAAAFPPAYATSRGPAHGAFFAAIAAATASHFAAGAMPRLECEPGRGIVAPAVSLLTRVKLVKPGRREVFLNDGIYGALMEVSQARDLMPRHRVIRDGRALDAGCGAWTVYGPTCDPLDVLPVKLALADDIAEGDFVEFSPVGAYGAATSTRFNGYEPGETVIVAETY